ncbi:MAG: hypothetical protein ABIQ97_00905, partial [Lysobacteraceae bacterium]
MSEPPFGDAGVNKDATEIINGHDARLVADQCLALSFPDAFDLASAERIEFPAQAAALSLAEENATLNHQNDALQRRI